MRIHAKAQSRQGAKKEKKRRWLVNRRRVGQSDLFPLFSVPLRLCDLAPLREKFLAVTLPRRRFSCPQFQIPAENGGTSLRSSPYRYFRDRNYFAFSASRASTSICTGCDCSTIRQLEAGSKWITPGAAGIAPGGPGHAALDPLDQGGNPPALWRGGVDLVELQFQSRGQGLAAWSPGWSARRRRDSPTPAARATWARAAANGCFWTFSDAFRSSATPAARSAARSTRISAPVCFFR